MEGFVISLPCPSCKSTSSWRVVVSGAQAIVKHAERLIDKGRFWPHSEGWKETPKVLSHNHRKRLFWKADALYTVFKSESDSFMAATWHAVSLEPPFF